MKMGVDPDIEMDGLASAAPSAITVTVLMNAIKMSVRANAGET